MATEVAVNLIDISSFLMGVDEPWLRNANKALRYLYNTLLNETNIFSSTHFFLINRARRPPRLQGRGMNRPIQHSSMALQSVKIHHLSSYAFTGFLSVSD